MKNLFEYFTPHQVAFEVLFIVCLLFVNAKWKFFAEALSESNAPSSKRIIAFIMAITICFCEMYHTIKCGKLEYQHLVAILLAIGAILGIYTLPDILAAWKGTQSKTDDQKPLP